MSIFYEIEFAKYILPYPLIWFCPFSCYWVIWNFGFSTTSFFIFPAAKLWLIFKHLWQVIIFCFQLFHLLACLKWAEMLRFQRVALFDTTSLSFKEYARNYRHGIFCLKYLLHFEVFSCQGAVREKLCFHWGIFFLSPYSHGRAH